MFLADDHDLFRKALRCLLEREKDFEIVGEASDGQSAVRQILEIMPDVVVMDIMMPEMNGIEATRQLMKQAPNLKVIAMSLYSNRNCIKEMLQAGAVGYLLKSGAAEDVLTAIRSVQLHQFFFSPSIALIVKADYCGSFPGSVKEGQNEDLVALSPKEQEVLRHLAGEKNIKEIAKILGLSIQSVDVYKLRIMKKLNIDTIAGLAKYAIRQGYVTLDA